MAACTEGDETDEDSDLDVEKLVYDDDIINTEQFLNKCTTKIAPIIQNKKKHIYSQSNKLNNLIQKWNNDNGLQTKMSKFLQTNDEEFAPSDDDLDLIQGITELAMDCLTTLLDVDQEQSPTDINDQKHSTTILDDIGDCSKYIMNKYIQTKTKESIKQIAELYVYVLLINYYSLLIYLYIYRPLAKDRRARYNKINIWNDKRRDGYFEHINIWSLKNRHKFFKINETVAIKSPSLQLPKCDNILTICKIKSIESKPNGLVYTLDHLNNSHPKNFILHKSAFSMYPIPSIQDVPYKIRPVFPKGSKVMVKCYPHYCLPAEVLTEPKYEDEFYYLLVKINDTDQPKTGYYDIESVIPDPYVNDVEQVKHDDDDDSDNDDYYYACMLL